MRKVLARCAAVLLLLALPFGGCARRSAAEPDTLTILYYSDGVREIREAYGEARVSDQTMPMVRFITPDGDYGNMDEVYDSLMTGLLEKSPEVDLFCIPGGDARTHTILRNHYYVDLSRYEALTPYYDALYPRIREWCADGDEVFGFPYQVFYPMLIMADESGMRSVGYTPDDIRSMDGLLEFCDVWDSRKASSSTSGYYRPVLVYCENYMLSQYDRQTGELNLDTPEFREILSQCGELAENGIFSEPYAWITDVDSDASPLYFGSVNLLSRDYRQYEPVPYPLLDGESADAKRFAEVFWFVINPYSAHKDQAAKVIEAIAERAGKADLVVTPIYRDSARYADTKLYTQENLDSVAPFIGECFAAVRFPGFDEVTKKLNEYVTGEESLDVTIREAQRILDMMREEQYIDQ